VSDPRQDLNPSQNGKSEAGASASAAISVRDNISVTHIAARRGMQSAVEAQALATFGVGLPSTPLVVETVRMTIVWAGPDQWLIVQPEAEGVDQSAELAMAFKGLASVVDVSDSRAVFRVSGAAATDALSRGMPIDLDWRVFKPGDAAITHADHLGVIVWRTADGQAYDLACARTYSTNFINWLRHTLAAGQGAD
jgi:sarcosine oxidase subunit gamma